MPPYREETIPCLVADNKDLFLDALHTNLDIFEQQQKKSKILPRYDYVFNAEFQNLGSQGERIFRQFETTLANGFLSKWTPHVFQKEFLELAKKVLCRQILGPDYQEYMPILCQEKNWDMTHDTQMLLGTAPRRFGKTIAIAMVAAAFALTVPNKIQAIFSTSQRISSYVGDLIKKAIIASGNEHRIKKFGEETMIITGDNDNDERVIHYYPANATVSLFILFFIFFLLFYVLCLFLELVPFFFLKGRKKIF